jgi:hypothetical protein
MNAMRLVLPRDNFTSSIKRVLAARVCHRCSNPECRKPTSGPQEDASKAANIGVAAHIRAASSQGARYDPGQSASARSSADNGIWLCQNCAKLVDNDEALFTVLLLSSWKQRAEQEARVALQGRSKSDDDLDSFIRLASKMPTLIEDMARDLHGDKTELIREFVILPTSGNSFWHEYPRFEYYESVHPNVQNAVRLLLDYRFLADVTPKTWPVYRMTEQFVDLVKILCPPIET